MLLQITHGDQTAFTQLFNKYGGQSINKFSVNDIGQDSLRRLHNQPFKDLVKWLNTWIRNYYPFQNSVAYNGKVDIVIRIESVTLSILLKLDLYGG